MEKNKRPSRYFISATIMVIGTVVALSACRSMPPSQPEPTISAFETTYAMRLHAGDVIELKFPYAGQFDETQTIMPNGKIILPLVGEVMAAGKTPGELQSELIELHSEFLQHPQLAVIVRSFFGNKAYIGGEVRNPGHIELPGQLTLLQGIVRAGGFNMDLAQVKNVVVIRHLENQRYSYAVDLEDAIEGKPYEFFYLQPQDIVYVPRTTIANVNLWVEQHIYRLLPIGRLGYNINP
jgi:polysaccharide biosynthesis/export protein